MRPEDHRYWDSVHNRHEGERAFILATGPSLKDTIRYPTALEDEICVGINHLLRWKELPVLPQYWAVSEYDDFYKVADDFDVEDDYGYRFSLIEKWFAHVTWHTYNALQPDFKPDDTWHWIWVDARSSWSGFEEKWKDKPDLLGLGEEFWRVGVGHTPVIECAIPALVWMGVKEIYLLGVDHTDADHVYAADGQRGARVEAANKAYANLVPELERYGITLRNCSPNSKAPVPYIPLEEVLNA